MADSCVALRTNFAAQTPVYDEIFLEDYKPLDNAFLGRHETEVWKMGTGDTHISDRIEIGMPDLQGEWQTISAAECSNACDAPRTHVGFGTTRGEHNMKQKDLVSQLFCLTQMRYNTRPSEQVSRIMKGLKKIPEMYTADFLQVEAFKNAPVVQVASDDFQTFTPDIVGPVTNITGQLTTIDLGSAANLPQSALTFEYLDYLSADLDLEGYFEGGSGLGMGLQNLITDKRQWFRMTNGRDSMKDMMALTNPQDASPLYRIGVGVQKPFGNYVPTLNRMPIRFQLTEGGSGGVINRVQEYVNVATTTGIRRQPNTAWINARIQLSWIWHPKSIKLFTPQYKKIHEKVPQVNTALYGDWQFINPQGLLQYTMPDGTVCTKNNDKQQWFYWLVAMEMGFQYMYPEWVVPILHLVDGSGLNAVTNDAPCGTFPAYVEQDYSDDPTTCET